MLLALADGLWVGLGSDHTDRKMEAHGVALAKQLCRKPMAAGLWRFDELIPHWDKLILRAHIVEDGGRAGPGSAGTGESGERTLYMEAPLAAVRRPEDLIRDDASALGRSGDPALPVGTVMFTGAIGAIGGIRPARRFEMSLEDPIRGRTLTHAYEVRALPIVT